MIVAKRGGDVETYMRKQRENSLLGKMEDNAKDPENSGVSIEMT